MSTSARRARLVLLPAVIASVIGALLAAPTSAGASPPSPAGTRIGTAAVWVHNADGTVSELTR